MRATCLSPLAIIALACLWQPSFAQDKPVANDAAPARIGTLSPDEARRAERARKRRAAAAHPAQPRDAGPTREVKGPTPPEPRRIVEKPQRPVETAHVSNPPPIAVHTRVASAHRIRVAHVHIAHPQRRRVAAQTEGRDELPRYHRSHNRRVVFARPRWTPKVGETVPVGVPLYPLPPAYGAAPAYGYGAAEPVRPDWNYQQGPIYVYPPVAAPGFGYADE